MDREKLSWRSFADRGTIAAKWGSPGTPTIYLIDPKGVIRHRWTGNPGEKAIDAALERMFLEAE